ncbi:hypothetical protein [Microbulbifer halophilus]|uniref:Uncharacterized protein n=1 Tax=Microbulbifer halophilus TaxID=453963 RepID=A0ABW5ECV0_9GAMM|nr:hypothetical protein [Microbulbifer halophilus]MCW8126408.1 hypothetical protein [Microbulbifer halophilus]
MAVHVDANEAVEKLRPLLAVHILPKIAILREFWTSSALRKAFQGTLRTENLPASGLLEFFYSLNEAVEKLFLENSSSRYILD